MIVALGAYKGVATPLQAGMALQQGLTNQHPAVDATLRPVTDGGEGTVEVIHHYLGGVVAHEAAEGPVGRAVRATVLWLDPATAVIESAQTVGYSLVPPGRRDPWRVSSRGVGQLIRLVADAGARVVYVTMGDSLVMDMGLGALEALGVRMLGADGRQVSLRSLHDAQRIVKIDTSRCVWRRARPDVRVLGDTFDHLTGANGQVAVYGRQKGLRDEDQDAMTGVADHINGLFSDSFGRDLGTLPLSSGSGGLAAALHGLFEAPMEHCMQWLFERTGLDEELAAAPAVVTGEGRLDEQTRWGKAPWMVATRCRGRLLAAVGASTEQGRLDLREAAAPADVSFVHVPLEGGAEGRDAWLGSLAASVAPHVSG